MEISAFQKLMHELYYDKDRHRGIEGTFLWLISEIGELSEAIRKLLSEKKDGILGNIEEEMADVFAWLVSLANILDLNLEEITLNKYHFVCPRCQKKPCRCTEK